MLYSRRPLSITGTFYWKSELSGIWLAIFAKNKIWTVIGLANVLILLQPVSVFIYGNK